MDVSMDTMHLIDSLDLSEGCALTSTPRLSCFSLFFNNDKGPFLGGVGAGWGGVIFDATKWHLRRDVILNPHSFIHLIQSRKPWIRRNMQQNIVCCQTSTWPRLPDGLTHDWTLRHAPCRWDITPYLSHHSSSLFHRTISKGLTKVECNGIPL